MFADQTTIPLIALYRTGTDPAVTHTDGRITPGIMWLDTSTGATGTLKKRNEANSGWDTLINLDGALPADHATEHQNGGGDEISVAGLSGVLADPQVADKVKESSGPTTLTVGAVADGEFFKRNGSSVIGSTAPAADINAFDFKASVRVATTANITLSGTQTIDGVSVIAGDRVLVKNQSTGSQNGIYICDAGAWPRSADADSSSEVTAGMFIPVAEGSTNGDTFWLLTTNDPITLGTTSLTFAQIGASVLSFPLLAPDGSSAAPSYAFTNGADCGLYLVNGTPDHLRVSVGNKEHLDIYQGTGNKPVVLLNLNNDNRLGWGNGSLRSGFADGGKGSVKAISDEGGTSGCVYSATADLVDVAGTRAPWHTAGQVFRHVLTGNRTIGPPKADGGSNSNSGVLITIILVQDATGSRTASWDSAYKWAGGSAPTLTTAGNSVDIFRFWCDGSNQAFELSRTMDVK